MVSETKKKLKNPIAAGLICATSDEGVKYYSIDEQGNKASSQLFKEEIAFPRMPKMVKLNGNLIQVGEKYVYGKCYEAYNGEVNFNMYIPVYTATMELVGYVDWLGAEITNINSSKGYQSSSAYCDAVIASAVVGGIVDNYSDACYADDKFYRSMVRRVRNSYKKEREALAKQDIMFIYVLNLGKKYEKLLRAIKVKRAAALKELKVHNKLLEELQ